MRRALILLPPLLLLAACSDGPPGSPSGARSFSVDLVDAGASQHRIRSQSLGTKAWSGGTSPVFFEAEPAVTLEAQVSRADWEGSGSFERDWVSVFLLPRPILPWLPAVQSEAGGVVVSDGAFLSNQSPGPLDILIAPGSLQADDFIEPTAPDEPARFLSGVLADPNTPLLQWELPELHEVTGRVRLTNGEALAGVAVSIYRAEQPALHLGVATETDADGAFSLELPEGRYDLVFSTPADGSLPIPPIRFSDQQLPLFPGLQLDVRYPVLPTRTVSVRVEDVGGTTRVGRVRIEGWVAEPPGGNHSFSGGVFRVEAETDSEGFLDRRLPNGHYRVRVFPRHGQRELSVADHTFEVVGTDAADGVQVETVILPSARLARIEVQRPDGTGMAGATLEMRMTSPPRFSWRELTDTDGAWVGLLPADLIDVEVIPATRAVEGVERREWSRRHGELDLRQAEASLLVQLRRSDTMSGVLVDKNGQGLDDVRVLLRDPETGELWDEAVTAEQGVFQGVLPRP